MALLFTTREGTVSALRGIKEASEPPLYIRAVEGVGEEARNEFVGGMPPFEVVGLDADLLVDKLEDAAFEHVMVDGRMQLSRGMIGELRRELSWACEAQGVTERAGVFLAAGFLFLVVPEDRALPSA